MSSTAAFIIIGIFVFVMFTLYVIRDQYEMGFDEGYNKCITKYNICIHTDEDECTFYNCTSKEKAWSKLYFEDIDDKEDVVSKEERKEDDEVEIIIHKSESESESDTSYLI
jgi:hypothetical protein